MKIPLPLLLHSNENFNILRESIGDVISRSCSNPKSLVSASWTNSTAAFVVKKTLLLVLAVFLLDASAVCRAQAEKSMPDTELSAVSIVVKGTTFSIYNASGSTLEVFSLTGTKVAAVRITSNEETVNLTLKKGCYILKVDKVVRKVSIR